MTLWLTLLSVVAAAPDAGQAPSTVSGRVVDQNGEPAPGFEVVLTDTTRFTGQVVAGCATFHPQQHLTSGADGTFKAELPFTPNEAYLGEPPHGYEPRGPPQPVEAVKPVELRVYKVPLRAVQGRVVDATGAPVAAARLSANYGGATSGEDGRFTLETRLDKPAPVHVRKMGFKPIDVAPEKLEHVVLSVKRTLLAVKVVDPKTKAPVHGVRVAAYRGTELVSYCTAGDVEYTHEANPGECTLDADPGSLELRVGTVSRKLKVAGETMAVTLEAEEKR